MSTTSLPSFHVANVSAVTDRILVGGDLDHDGDLAIQQAIELAENGVTHVADCRFEADDALFWAEDPEMTYGWFGVDDAGQRMPDAFWDDAVAFLQEALADPEAIVLAHCHMGINRGPSLGYALLLAEGWDPVEAIDAIRRARPIAHAYYAEDALAWHHRRMAVPPEQRRRDRAALRAWRKANQLDVAHVIRQQRARGL